jgi:hypothetical protein
MSFLVSDLLNDAAAELNVQSGLTPDDQALMMRRLDSIFDNWNVNRDAVWCDIFTEFTLTPNHNPHTLGPVGADWAISIRPVKLTACALVLTTSTPNLYIPIDIISRKEYENIPQPGLTSGYPRYVYYERDFPVGKLFFYTVPTIAYKVRLTTSTLLSGTTLSTDLSITLPPGGPNAVMLTLAEDCAAAFGRAVMPSTAQKAREARARFFNANVEIPFLHTRAPGMQQGRGRQTSYNYHDRSFR